MYCTDEAHNHKTNYESIFVWEINSEYTHQKINIHSIDSNTYVQLYECMSVHVYKHI